MNTICLLNDCFPPQIDGVANVVLNYASEIEKNYGHALVVVPEYPGADDSEYDFSVCRYKALDTRNKLDYMTGLPFRPGTVGRLKKENISLMHAHCPVTSALLARSVRGIANVPLVMTYHTRYDIEVAKLLKTKLMQESVLNAMVQIVSSFDEVWTVSRGAGESLKKLGYKGDYVVMENGVDLPFGRLTEEECHKVTAGYDLPADVPVFLFVGRLMWYKGIRIIADALAALKSNGMDFRMVFVGRGQDEKEIREYTEKSGIGDKCIFTGPVHDRNGLRAWYSRADALVFPSTFDTNGLVVREAAASMLPSVLVRGSCAAEGVTDGRNAYLIEENAASLAVMLYRICQDRNAMRKVGENAGSELYISWSGAVAKACERYDLVIDDFRSGKYPKHKKLGDEILGSVGGFMETLSKVKESKGAASR